MMSNIKLSKKERLWRFLTKIKKALYIKDKYFPHIFYQKIIIFILGEILLCIGSTLYTGGYMFSLVFLPIGFTMIVYIFLVTVLEDKRQHQVRRKRINDEYQPSSISN